MEKLGMTITWVRFFFFLKYVLLHFLPVSFPIVVVFFFSQIGKLEVADYSIAYYT